MTKKEIEILDNLWAKAVKVVGRERCLVCGKTTHLNAHHFYSRSNRSIRWYLPNGCCLCSGHHVLCNDSAHKSPADFVDFMVNERGEEWLDDLRNRKNEIKKHLCFNEIKQYLEETIQDYKHKIF